MIRSFLSIRAIPLRAGWKPPEVRFKSAFEGEFTVDTTEAQARALGGHLFEEINIIVRVVRNSDGSIRRGRLDSFERLQSGESQGAWRESYQIIGGHDIN